MTTCSSRPGSVTAALLVLAVVALFTAACGGGGSEGPTAANGPSDSEVEFQSFMLANDARTSNGVNPELSLDSVISSVARDHSHAMRDQGFFGHGGSGGGLAARLRGAGISFSAAGENLAKITAAGDPAGAAHSQFLSSPEHRQVMLDSRYHQVGVGVARSGDTVWLTQIYIEP